MDLIGAIVFFVVADSGIPNSEGDRWTWLAISDIFLSRIFFWMQSVFWYGSTLMAEDHER